MISELLRSKIANPGKPKSLLKTFSTIVFGYDFFISFKLGNPPIGTQSYASDLARSLRELDFTVFFSEEEAPPGGKLDSTLIDALHGSRILVVIVNEGALVHSQWVYKEVQEFRRKHPKRPVIPINIDHTIEKYRSKIEASKWLNTDDVIRLDEPMEAISQGIVNPDVLKRLLLTPKFIRANIRFRRLIIFVIALLLGLGVFAWIKKDESHNRFVAYNINQGRSALTSGRAQEAAPSLLRAFKEGADTPALRFMLAQSFTSLDTLIASIDGTAIAFSDDGAQFAVALADGKVQIWSISERRLTVTLHNKVPGARKLVFAPDGKSLAITAEIGDSIYENEPFIQEQYCLIGVNSSKVVVTYWDTRSGTLLQTFEPLDKVEGCWESFFSESGRKLTLAGWTTERASLYWTITKFDTASFNAVSATLTENTAKRNCREFSKNAVIKMLSEDTGSKCDGTLAAISADGALIALAPWELPQRELSLWDVRQGRTQVLPFNRDTEVMGASFSLDNGLIAITLTEGVEVWNIHPVSKLHLVPLDTSSLPAELSPDGSLLVAISGQRSAVIFHARSGQRLAQIEGHAARIRVVKFSPDGDRVLTAGDDGVAKVWDAWTGKLLLTLEGHRKPIIRANFSPDLRFIATEDREHHIKIWHGRPPHMPRILRDDPKWVKWGTGDEFRLRDAFSSGEAILVEQNDVWTEEGNLLSLWNLKTGVLASRRRVANSQLFTSTQSISQITHCHDKANNQFSDAILASSNNKNVDLIQNGIVTNVAFLQVKADDCRIIPLERHNSAIISAVFSKDDNFVITIDKDGNTMVWSTDNGQLLAQYAAPEPISVSYVPGEKAITLHEQSTAMVWHLSQEKRGVTELERIIACSEIYTHDELAGLAISSKQSCSHEVRLPETEDVTTYADTAHALFVTAWGRRNERSWAEPHLQTASLFYQKSGDLFGEVTCHLALRAIATLSGDIEQSSKQAEVVRKLIHNLNSTEGQQESLMRLGSIAFNEFGDNEIARYAYEQVLAHTPQSTQAKLGLWEASLPIIHRKGWLKSVPIDNTNDSSSERSRIIEWMISVLSGLKNEDLAYEAWSMYEGDSRNPITERLDFRGIRREISKSDFPLKIKKQVLNTLELLEVPGNQGNKLKSYLGVPESRGLAGP